MKSQTVMLWQLPFWLLCDNTRKRFRWVHSTFPHGCGIEFTEARCDVPYKIHIHHEAHMLVRTYTCCHLMEGCVNLQSLQNSMRTLALFRCCVANAEPVASDGDVERAVSYLVRSPG